MNWKVNYSSQSKVDLDSVYEYIAFTLFSPEAARRKVKRITEAIGLLKTFPFCISCMKKNHGNQKDFVFLM